MILVSNNLKQIRINKGFTQKEMARRVGITLTNYGYIELGKSEPRLKTALLISKVLEESIHRLFSLEEKKYE